MTGFLQLCSRSDQHFTCIYGFKKEKTSYFRRNIGLRLVMPIQHGTVNNQPIMVDLKTLCPPPELRFRLNINCFIFLFYQLTPAMAQPPEVQSTYRFQLSGSSADMSHQLYLHTHTHTRTHIQTASNHCSINSPESIKGPAGVSSSATESNRHSTFICLRVC